MRTARAFLGRLAVSLVVVLAGCSRSLIPTPYVAYGDAGREMFAAVPEHLRTQEVPVIYVTDRDAPKQRTSGDGPAYTFARSPRVAYGVARVSLNPDATWEELVADSTGEHRTHRYSPRVSGVEEVGEFVPIVKHLAVADGQLAAKPTAIDDIDAEMASFHALLARYLDHSDRKEAVVFIHGFNNSFDDGVLRVAEAWHFGGRQGVPIVYSWPAGSGGLKGYAYDRESGEFTIVHLKLLLAALARCPQLERIHVVSHSRGTDVAITALRELHAECRGVLGTGAITRIFRLVPPQLDSRLAAQETRDILKIESLILAAPDLDLDVFVQRFFGENLLMAARRTVIYFSREDDAIGLSNWLFRSRRRVGDLRLTDFTPESRELLGQLSDLQLINCTVTGGSSHSYMLQHPAALSDLILVLRDRRAPGADSGRPLTVPFPGVWELGNAYLKPGSDEPASPAE